MIDRWGKIDSILNELQRAHLHIIDIQNRTNISFRTDNYKQMFRREVAYAIELLLDYS